MEEKCLKTPVFTMETVFKDSAEVPVDIDFNLPDYCAEVSKILKCRAVARVSSKSVEGRNISIDGGVTITVIYSDDENAVNSYDYQYPFSKTFETGIDISDAFVKANAKCEYINCRAVTDRKIDIHGAVSLTVSAIQKKSRDVICDIDDDSIEVLRSGAPATMPIGMSEKYALIEEELEIGGSQPDVRGLIRYDADVCALECKLLAGKAIIKGEISINLVYRSEEGTVQPLHSTIPFSQLVEIEGAGEDCECSSSADIAYLEIKPKFNSSGQSRSFSVDAKLCLKAEVYCQNDIQVVQDAYSRKYEAQITSEDFCFDRMVLNINDTFNCRKEIDFSPDSISQVYDVWGNAYAENVRFEGDCLLVPGKAVLNILAADQSEMPVFYEKTVEFEYRFKMPFDGTDLKTEPNLSITEINYTISSGSSMEISLQISVCAAVYKCIYMPLVSNIKIDEQEPVAKRSNGAMTIYFADTGESLWSIARRYLADVDEIKKINDITEDELTSNRTILIPVN